MLNDRTEQALKDSEGLLRRLDRVEKFTTKYHIMPAREVGQIYDAMQELAASIPDIQRPTSQDELLLAEVKRRMQGQATYLEHQISGDLYDFNTVTQLYGIPEEDLKSLRPWLEQNKEKNQEAIEDLFKSKDMVEYELPLSGDIPSIRRQAEEVAGAHIERYHRSISKLLQGLTKTGEFARDVHIHPSTVDRSYFNHVTNKVGISIEGILFGKEDGTLGLREGELIRLYGHEGMGHALNWAITRAGGLPYLLTDGSNFTEATAESVAQFYEKQLLEDLRNSTETQKALDIEHRFPVIYQEAKDREQLNEYNKRISWYAIGVLADKSLGDPKDPAVLRKKIEKLAEVAVTRSGIASWVESKKDEFDSQGNLSPKIVGELRYCAQPVPRALDEFAKRGMSYDGKDRSYIDSTLLRGLWTPQGFVDNARLRAESK